MDNNNIQTTNQLLQQIDAEARAAKAGLNWAKAFLPVDALRHTRDKIIEGRVDMRHISRALQVNPAAAVFGESQVGKSYLVNNLLKNADDVFNIRYDAESQPVNFLEELNPIGGGAESTSLITRFTSRSLTSSDPKHPIKVVVFTPADITLTIADSYFSDIKNHNFPSKEAIADRLAALEARYKGQPEVQTWFTEDDVYEMKQYLDPVRFPIANYYIGILNELRFFQRIAAIIPAVPHTEWATLFSLLWNDNQIITDIYNTLTSLLSRLDFAHELYINILPLRNDKGTILSVDRIKEFFGITQDEDGNAIKVAEEPDMEVWTGTRTVNVKKSEFTSIAAEVVLQVPEDVAQQKTFLDTLDILDFPGARTRKNTDEQNINREKACDMILRGRVAYLFNKYSRNYLISSLLFCYHDEQSNVNTLAELLKGWITDMIGATPSDRADYLRGAEIPPLFIVGTKFNNDLKRNPKTEKPDTPEDKLLMTATNRWDNRFDKFLADIVDAKNSGDWYTEWTPGREFDNLYLLRDYDYSKDVFTGYEETHAETGIAPAYTDFVTRLSETFQNHPSVQKHFRSPSEAWQRSATPGNDGSQYIIENLIRASRHVGKARTDSFHRHIADNFRNIFDTLFAFYHDDNSDSLLSRSLEQAGKIELTLGILFSTHPYFFTEFLGAMLVSEDKLHDKVLDVAAEMKLVEKTDLTILIAIRERAGIDPSLSTEENVQRLLSTYHIRTREEMEEYLRNFGFSIADVINPPRAQNLPQVLVESLEQLWMERYISTERLSRFRDYGLSDSSIADIVNNLRALYFDKLGISAHIINKIRPYISTPDRLDEMAEMIADIVAEMFNKFINSFGTSYFTPELWDDIRATVAHNEFNVKVNQHDDSVCILDPEAARADMSQVFDVFENIDTILNSLPVDREKLAYFSNYNNYSHWAENMKVGFLATCDIPKYDINMNNQLRAIFLHSIFDSAELRPLVENTPGLEAKEEEMRAAVK